jgi:formate hydrogenlyase transcriptional activator
LWRSGAPPLRERREDIPALVRYFVDRFARRMNRRIEVIPDEAIPDEAIEALQRCSWPGNVRQLAKLIERAMILSPGPTLQIPVPEHEHTASLVARRNGTATLAQLERESILGVLEEANWLIAGPRGAAARLGMKRTTLQSLIKRLEITRPVRSLRAVS